ncbi:MAG: hypothetical protein E7269_00560 [Lachnospiraceae bacterium]|nr:hypothetical protein [Lachnospiraceae bacterium]
MKKFITLTMTLMMVLGTWSITALAETPDLVNVFVTIADGDGKLALAQEKIAVADSDGDGALTINDALYAAHEAKYAGGATAGYVSYAGAYGLSLDRLWGVANGGSYGYYLNNVSAWSLLDAVKEGDYVNAYVITDLTAWSDTYCYFDVQTAEAVAGEEITFTLSSAGYDANWNPAVFAVAGATIIVNGEETAYVTDAEGKVTIKIDDVGDYVISATSDAQVLVPPVCRMTVAEAEIGEATTGVTQETTPEEEATQQESTRTGDNSMWFAAAVVMIFATAIIFIKKKTAYEK